MGKASTTCRLLAAVCFLTYLPCTLTQTTSPRLLLILLDGFRHDYLNKTSAPHPGFDKLTRQGVRAKRLVPDFPSLSVPNWYSLMTGLHTEAHGMTGNHMHDVSREDNFLLYQYPHPDISSLWWQGGEPLWVTAARQNKSSSMFYWPGCEVEIQGYRPSFCQNYTGVPSLEEFRSALKTSLSKLEKGETDIAAIYHERTDYIGHVSGPESAQMQEAVLELDPIMSDLVDRLSDPAMSEVNLMVFSDHGMTELSSSRVIDISTVLDPADYSIVLEGAALASVYTTPEREAQVFEKLKDFHPNLTLYRKADLPERWHFKHGPHVAPVTAVADLGWFIKTPTEKGMSIPSYQGMHGYDNVHSDMHGFFIGFGPAFKQGEVVERLRNVDLYHVMCHALHLSPSPNNGSLYDVIPLLASDDAGDNTVTLLITFFSVVAVFVISARKNLGSFKMFGVLCLTAGIDAAPSCIMSLHSLPRSWRPGYVALVLALCIASYLLLYHRMARRDGSGDYSKARQIPRPPSGMAALKSFNLPPQGGKGGNVPYADDGMLRTAYKRSPCSGLEEDFVGSHPLFPPCDPSIPPGVATWGKYPYLGPFQYKKNSRNPCFTDSGGQFRCLPYFFLIGFSKCGTTDMYSRLSKHPQIAESRKEFAWFSRRRFPEYHYERVQNFSDYLDNFNGLAKTVEQELQQHGHSEKVVGDYSVMAVNEVFEWPQLSGNEGCTEPRVINAHHIRHLNPNVKVIVLMRHPVQRLYSRFLFDYKRSTLRDYRKETPINMTLRTPEKFHEYVVDGLQKYTDCFQRFSLRHCIYNRTLWETVHGLKIQDSMYTVLIEDWLRVVPRDQFIFLRSEDFRHDLKGVIKAVVKHLELDPLSTQEMEAVVSGTFRTVNKIPAPDMLPQTEQRLHHFFQPFIHRLAQFLNDPRFLWEDV